MDDEELLQRVNQPSDGLLVSIAMRLDRSFGVHHPGETQEHFENRQFNLLCDARRAVDEMVGRGFYNPKQEEEYQSLIHPNVLAHFKQFKGI